MAGDAVIFLKQRMTGYRLPAWREGPLADRSGGQHIGGIGREGGTEEKKYDPLGDQRHGSGHHRARHPQRFQRALSIWPHAQAPFCRIRLPFYVKPFPKCRRLRRAVSSDNARIDLP